MSINVVVVINTVGKIINTVIRSEVTQATPPDL